jgi:hypothetical protein
MMIYRDVIMAYNIIYYYYYYYIAVLVLNVSVDSGYWSASALFVAKESTVHTE